MKKFIIFVLAVTAFFVICAITTNASTDVDPSQGAYEPQMQVSFSNDNHYTVEIPTSLAEHETGEIKITNTQIEMGYHISTYITNLNANGYIDVENAEGKKSQIDIFVDGSSASTHKMDNKVCAFGEDGTRSLSVQRVNGADNKVGTYSGVVCFKFDVEAD